MHYALKAISLVAMASLIACDSSAPQTPAPRTAQKYEQAQTSPLCRIVGTGTYRPIAQAARAYFGSEHIKTPDHEVDLKNELDDKGNLAIYFRTNAWALHENDRRDIQGYVRSLPQRSHLVLEGYADRRGNDTDNDELGRKRGESVADIIKAITSMGHTYEITSYGRSKATATTKDGMKRDRKVTIVQVTSAIGRGLDNLLADTYLIDQSGSMNERTISGTSKWHAVLSYSFKPNAELFTFSSIPGPCNGPLDKVRPDGQTPLYASMLELITKTPSGKTITALTDGADNRSSNRQQDVSQIIQNANAKRIQINMIGV